MDLHHVHAFTEQFIMPSPAADSAIAQPRPTEALEFLAFLYADDGAEFVRGVVRALDITSG